MQYSKKFDNIVYGKFGGFGHDGERILLFYEGSVEGAEKRLNELKGDVMRSLMARQDFELDNLASNLREL